MACNHQVVGFLVHLCFIFIKWVWLLILTEILKFPGGKVDESSVSKF